MNRIFILSALFLLFSGAGQCKQRKDPRMSPISAEELTQQIQHTPLTSEAHTTLIARAQESHLLKTAYNQYTLLWRKKPESAYANLWRGSAAQSYWTYATHPNVSELRLDSPMANELFKVMQDCLSKAVRLAPDSARANAEYGDVLMRNLAQAKTGAKYLDKAVKLAPRDARILTMRGNAHSLPGAETYTPSKAINDLTQATLLAPDYAAPHWILARTHILTKEYSKAQKEVSRFLELTPPEAKKYVSFMQEQITQATHK